MRMFWLHLVALVLLGCGELHNEDPMFDPESPGTSAQFSDGNGGVSANWLNSVPASFNSIQEFIDATAPGQVGRIVELDDQFWDSMDSLAGFGGPASVSSATFKCDGRYIYLSLQSAGGVIVLDLNERTGGVQNLEVFTTLVQTHPSGRIASDGKYLVVVNSPAGAGTNDHLTVYDVQDGFNELYSLEMAPAIQDSIHVAVGGGFIYVYANDLGQVVQFNAATGAATGQVVVAAYDLLEVSAKWVVFGTAATTVHIATHAQFGSSSTKVHTSTGAASIASLAIGPQYAWVGHASGFDRVSLDGEATFETYTVPGGAGVDGIFSDGRWVGVRYGTSLSFYSVEGGTKRRTRTIAGTDRFVIDGMDVFLYEPGTSTMTRHRGMSTSREFLNPNITSSGRRWPIMVEPLDD